MKVDGYEVQYQAIADVIDKLCEADGSPIEQSRQDYLADAARILMVAGIELAQED